MAGRRNRQIQDMIATDTLVKRGEAGEGAVGTASGWPRPASSHPQASRMRRSDSEDVLGSLLVEGMPDRDAAANLEDVPEGEVSRVMAGNLAGGGIHAPALESVHHGAGLWGEQDTAVDSREIRRRVHVCACSFDRSVASRMILRVHGWLVMRTLLTFETSSLSWKSVRRPRVPASQ